MLRGEAAKVAHVEASGLCGNRIWTAAHVCKRFSHNQKVPLPLSAGQRESVDVWHIELSPYVF
jgi:hypothetical protein